MTTRREVMCAAPLLAAVFAAGWLTGRGKRADPPAAPGYWEEVEALAERYRPAIERLDELRREGRHADADLLYEEIRRLRKSELAVICRRHGRAVPPPLAPP